jgi:hypothetical protein
VINLRWSVIAAAMAFVISLILGISVRGQVLIILLRALGFAVAFFFLSSLIWHLINRYIPDLLTGPPAQDPSVMLGLENGSRVNITVGEDSIPPDVALPPERPADDAVGNITEMIGGVYSSQGSFVAAETAAPAAGPAVPPAPASAPSSPAAPAAGIPVPPVSASSQGMDQGPQSGYTQNGNVVSGASIPPLSAPARASSGVLKLGDTSGSVESLPDLDALAGTFLSPDAEGGEEGVSSPRSHSSGGARSKGKDMGEDFNPKELASAIQTILKRD